MGARQPRRLPFPQFDARPFDGRIVFHDFPNMGKPIQLRLKTPHRKIPVPSPLLTHLQNLTRDVRQSPLKCVPALPCRNKRDMIESK